MTNSAPTPIFMCGDADAELALAVIESSLEAGRCIRRKLPRGIEEPTA